MRDFYDPTPRCGWLARAYDTPVSDAFHGELTARLDARRVIAAAGLPAPLPGLIYAVVRRSRLRRGERLDVARELIAHFNRQLATGRSAAELAGDFGLPDQMASLIRQTMVGRRRPLWNRRATKDEQCGLFAVGLPAALSAVVETVVRSSRLWRREKLDVARELTAHFADGLAAGRTPDELTRDFGPVEQAAQLIRQAKIRNRSFVWHCRRMALRALAITLFVALIAYGLLAARFYFASPAVAHNYWQDINAARQAGESDAAWPLYRQAIIKLGDPQDKVANLMADPLWADWVDQGPAGEHWSRIVAIVERYQDSIKLAREAAEKPQMGYLLGNPEDRKAYLAAHADWLAKAKPQSADANTELVGAHLDGVQNLRDVARLLWADARVAAVAGEGDRVVEDIVASLAMAAQIYQPRSFLVEQLVSLAIFDTTLDKLAAILAETPEVLSDGQLRDLAHAIAAYRDDALVMDFTAEHDIVDDILQRTFTDDGHGDGRVTPAAWVWLEQFGDLRPALHGEATLRTTLRTTMLQPGLSAVIASRAQMREMIQSLANEQAADHVGPPWLWNTEKINATNDRMRQLSAGRLEQLRYFLPTLLMPATTQVYIAAERAIQVRDAVEVALALELYHRRHGDWPASLDQLVPDLLPAVPPDRFDGQPLRYLVRDGRPVLYSVGADRDDDRGRPTALASSAIPIEYGQLTPASLARYQTHDHDGDWILWPPLPPEKPQPESPPSEED
jgi:uncharacterized membrane protein